MFHEKFYQSDVSPKPAAYAVNAGAPLGILDSLLSKGEGAPSFGLECALYRGRLFAEVWWPFFQRHLLPRCRISHRGIAQLTFLIPLFLQGYL